MTTEGFETDVLWQTPVEGLTFHGAFAYTDATYTKDFFNIAGANLKDDDLALNAKYSGNLGVSYEMPAPWLDGWRISTSFDGRYSGEYKLANTPDSDVQDSFWLTNAAIRLFSEDGEYEIAIMGRNLGDNIYAQGQGGRPGARAFTPGGRVDQVVTTALGREATVQVKVNL